MIPRKSGPGGPVYQRYDDDHFGGGSGGGGGSSKDDVPHVAPLQQAPEVESRSDTIERLKDEKRKREKKP